MTEKEIMVSGGLYNPNVPELVYDRLQARRLLFDYNHSHPGEKEKRRHILASLFGSGEKCYIKPSFQCDHGYNIHFGENLYLNFNCVILDVCRVTLAAMFFWLQTKNL